MQKLKNSMFDDPFDFCGLPKKCGFATFSRNIAKVMSI